MAFPYHLAAGAAVRPWARIDRVTVTMTTVRMVCDPGVSASSRTNSAKRIDARPRGPNQPRKPTVGRRTPEPINESATGIIRTAVKLSTAYSTTTGPV